MQNDSMCHVAHQQCHWLHQWFSWMTPQTQVSPHYKLLLIFLSTGHFPMTVSPPYMFKSFVYCSLTHDLILIGFPNIIYICDNILPSNTQNLLFTLFKFWNLVCKVLCIKSVKPKTLVMLSNWEYQNKFLPTPSLHICTCSDIETRSIIKTFVMPLPLYCISFFNVHS